MGMLPGSLSGASDMGEEADHVGPGGGWRVGQLFSPEQVKKGKFFIFEIYSPSLGYFHIHTRIVAFFTPYSLIPIQYVHTFSM